MKDFKPQIQEIAENFNLNKYKKMILRPFIVKWLKITLKILVVGRGWEIYLNIYYFKRPNDKVEFSAERNLYDIFKELNKSNMSNFLSCKKYHWKIKRNF